MKARVCLLAILLITSFAAAQMSSDLVSHTDGTPGSDMTPQGTWHQDDSGERMFFPRDMFWGWAQFDLAPPHNEVDPNLCGGNAGQYGGVNAPCSLFARYMLSGIL